MKSSWGADIENGVTRSPAERASVYEAAMAATVGVSHAFAFSHGRVALSRILLAAGLRPGDEVVLSPLTCKVVPLTILSLGLSPRYADVGAGTLNLTAGSVAGAISKKTRVVLFQCTYGSMVGRQEVAELASKRGILLVEDRAQCMPGDKHPLAEEGAAAIYSNNLTKPLPAGSGGLAVTNDASLQRELAVLQRKLPEVSGNSRLRLEGALHRRLLRPGSYWWLLDLKRAVEKGYRDQSIDREVESEVTCVASRVSDYQVQLGLHWLDRLDELVRHRRICCADYRQLLEGQEGLVLPELDAEEALYYYPVIVKDKEELLKSARRSRLELVAWPTTTPIFPIDDPDRLLAYGYRMGRCETADRLASKLVGLPTHEHVTAHFRKRLTSLIKIAHSESGAAEVPRD